MRTNLSFRTDAIGRRSGIAVMAVLLCWSTVLAADEPEVRAGIGAEEIFFGESVDYQVEIRNVKNPPAPDLSDFKTQFEVVAAGDESRNQSSISIINGRVSEQNVLSHVYHFRLTPKSAGELTVPSPKVTINGKLLTGGKGTLRVTAAEEQDLVIVEIDCNLDKVYPTQPFVVTVRILIRPLPNDDNKDPLSPLRRQPPHLQINWVDPIPGLTTEDKSQWLQSLLSDEGVGFTLNDLKPRSGSFFDVPRALVFNIQHGRESRQGLDGESVKYFVYELTRTFTPEKTGIYTFGPAVVKGTFVGSVDRREYKGKRLVAIAPPLTIEVSEVPTPRPATYCGGIGEYTITASANPTKLRVGDPLTLTLEFERGSQSGSLELISAPDLSVISGISDAFDLIDKEPTGRIEGAKKKFVYALRPKRAGVSLPSIPVVTFNPGSEKFTSIALPAISLEVLEAERVTGSDLVGNRSSASASTIKTRAQGIFQNITDPKEVFDERVNVVDWAITTAAIWGVMLITIVIVTLYRQKRSDPAWVRRQNARGLSKRRLADANRCYQRGERAEALRAVRAAIAGIAADFQNINADGLTTSDLDAIMIKSGVVDEDRLATTRLLEQIDAAEFGAGQAADPELIIKTAASLLTRIAPKLERGSKR